MSLPPSIIKRCERCEQTFEIPNIRSSVARETLLVCYPCPHCLFSVCDKTGNSGRCRECSIPFTMVKHQAQGLCNRDYMRMLRNATKEP